jgi:hypothetical protein
MKNKTTPGFLYNEALSPEANEHIKQLFIKAEEKYPSELFTTAMNNISFLKSALHSRVMDDNGSEDQRILDLKLELAEFFDELRIIDKDALSPTKADMPVFLIDYDYPHNTLENCENMMHQQVRHIAYSLKIFPMPYGSQIINC